MGGDPQACVRPAHEMGASSACAGTPTALADGLDLHI